MSPGPKPLSLARLKHHTRVAGKLLFLLRDGREGRWLKTNVRDPQLQKAIRIVPVNLSSAEIDAIWKKLEPLNEDTEFYSVERPVNPASELWNALKRAKSEREIKNVADKIAQWDRKQGLGYTPVPHMAQPPEYDFVRVLRDNARSVLKAKHLPEYPKSHKRLSSDNKRVWFFAKVLAGLMLGWSPLYVLKRLSRWHGEPCPELKKGKRQ